MSPKGSPSYTLRPPHPDELERVVEFIYRQQAHPATRCLHLDWHRDGIRADVQDLDVPFHEAFLLAWEGETLVGVLGCDNDLEASRAWLHGPFARAHDWHLIVTALFQATWAALPPAIQRVSNYIELAYAPARDFHAQWGFVEKDISHIYQVDAYAVALPDGVRPFVPSDAEMLCALHPQAFPKTWLSAPQMMARCDARNPLWIAWEDGVRVGYLRASQHVALPEAAIDFVAVHPDARGRGWGRRLLQTALHWAFQERQLAQAFLNVSASNTQARGLYEQVGFRCQHSGVALDWFAPQAGES